MSDRPVNADACGAAVRRLARMRYRTAASLISAILALLPPSSALGQSKQEGERLLRDQEQRLGISCKSLHQKAHAFVESHVAPLASRSTVAAPMEQRFIEMTQEARVLADQTHKCYGLQPIAIHSRLSFPPDFGELHEVLRRALELVNSFQSGEPEAAKAFRLKDLQKHMHQLKTGTGRRYPGRV
jgi:hypothetical protein